MQELNQAEIEMVSGGTFMLKLMVGQLALNYLNQLFNGQGNQTPNLGNLLPWTCGCKK